MTEAHGVARDQLRAFVERIERLEEEKKTIADDIKDVYGEAKSMGFDTKILKMVISLRKKDEQERTEQEIILDTYLQALGMIPAFERAEDQPVTAKELQHPVSHATGANARTGGDDSTVRGARTEADAVTDRRDDHLTPPSDDDAIAAVKGKARLANVSGVEPSSSASHSLSDGSAAANTGGDHVTEPVRAATHQAGPDLVSETRPAKHLLRSHRHE